MANSQYHPAYYQPIQMGMNAALLQEAIRPFHSKLFDSARQFLNANQVEMAVVYAQASGEMCTEFALTLLLQKRRVEDLTEPILSQFRVRDILNERLRALYIALSGDHIQQQPFWEQLKKHHTRRNDVVHKGAKCTKTEAEESISVINQYIEHIEKVVMGKIQQ